ncbi:MAG: histidine phosphatase family protein [Promethearchaeota archaeon]
MVNIILVQHCQSEHHINDMSGGWTDTPLTKLGREQANLIGQRLNREINKERKEDYAIFSSDLKRAWQTAEIIGEHLNLNVIADKGLREINTGVAAGKTKEWANSNRNPKNEINFDLDYQEFQNGETWRQFYSRVCSCLERLFDLNAAKKNLIIVTHGGTLGFIIAWWMKFEEHMLSKSYFSASPASLSFLQETENHRHILKSLNDTSHLS